MHCASAHSSKIIEDCIKFYKHNERHTADPAAIGPFAEHSLLRYWAQR